MMRGNTTKRTERRLQSSVTGVPIPTNRPSNWETVAKPLHLRIQDRNGFRLDITHAERFFGDQFPYLWAVIQNGSPVCIVATGRAESLAQAKLMCLRRAKPKKQENQK